MGEDSQEPRLHVDSDWKAQAQAEKQRLREQAERARAEQAASSAGAAGAGAAGAATRPAGGEPGAAGAGAEAAPASFPTLVSTLATQALFAMGAFADPRTGQRYQNFDLARHHIDMLGVLEEKTKGNLTDEEATMLASTLYELRMRYVQLGEASRQASQ
ncbi:MAG: DUF1844 domain-containing protein [Phycisphaeraceae bacterium]